MEIYSYAGALKLNDFNDYDQDWNNNGVVWAPALRARKIEEEIHFCTYFLLCCRFILINAVLSKILHYFSLQASLRSFEITAEN